MSIFIVPPYRTRLHLGGGLDGDRWRRHTPPAYGIGARGGVGTVNGYSAQALGDCIGIVRGDITLTEEKVEVGLHLGEDMG